MIRFLPILLAGFYILFMLVRIFGGHRPSWPEILGLAFAVFLFGSMVYYIVTTN